MTVHFFTRGDIRSADSRHRAFQIAEKLNELGVSSVVESPPALALSLTPWPAKATLISELFRSLSRIKKGDIVYLQRTISNKYFFIITAVYLLFFRPKIIFDFCDPVYVVNPFKTKAFTYMADAVVVSTHAQEEWAKRHNKNVHLVHISLDSSLYGKFTKKYNHTSKRAVIGWVGTANNHMLNLEILASVFKKMLTQGDISFTFVLIGAFKYQKVYDLFTSIEGLDVQFIDELEYSSPESVAREIQKFDIGVVPHVSFTRWNQGKTSLKILEYMACGVATVASNAGELPYIIQDGVNGFLAQNEDEWVDKITLLLKDPALRECLGQAGQNTVREQYSFDAIIPRIQRIIASLT